MICSCTNCGAQFNIAESKIPDKGAKVKCLKCKQFFRVTKKGKAPAKESPKPKKEKPPPEPPSDQSASSDGDLPPKAPPEANQKNEEECAPCEECKGGGSPPWVMTFADLATLMLTFFVLLLSFANMDIAKFQEMLGSVQDAFGVTKKTKGQFQSTLQGEESDVETSAPSATEEKAKEEMERQRMAEDVQKTVDEIKESKNISVKVGENGVRVRVKGGYFFGPGSSNIKGKAVPFLNNIADLMKVYPLKLQVEGHTDNVPISTAKFPSNWELSASRATIVLRYFTERKGIDPSRLTAIGFADNKPIASNDDAGGRAKNRRVEFIFNK